MTTVPVTYAGPRDAPIVDVLRHLHGIAFRMNATVEMTSGRYDDPAFPARTWPVYLHLRSRAPDARVLCGWRARDAAHLADGVRSLAYLLSR